MNGPQIVTDRPFEGTALRKVERLLGILAEIRENPYLSERFALQGGTALHLFRLGLLRLSVDIDLIYTGAVDRETLAAEPQVLGELESLLRRLGYEPGAAGSEHAGVTYKLRYEDDGRPDYSKWT